MSIPVQFVYYTGFLARRPLQNARLTGSWDKNGRYSDQWSAVAMSAQTGEDGCPCFRATVEFDEAQVGRLFRWGVWIDGPSGPNLWGIMTEVNDRVSTRRERAFTLRQAANQEERYYLTQCRRLGANKYWRAAAADPGIRFAVWAPNAQNVEVVMGRLWSRTDGRIRPVDGPVPVELLCGGYVDDEGNGARSDLGPFAMTRGADGVWVTDATDAGLQNFQGLDHHPYMFRITKDNGLVSYRSDLHSRCQIGAGVFDPSGDQYEGSTLDLEGTVSCSVAIDPELVTRFFREDCLFEDQVNWAPSGRPRVWREREFIPAERFWAREFDPRRPVPTRVEDLVIYELHVGALGFGRTDDQGRPAPGTLEDAIKLLDYLEDLGVNAVELLPMSEFGGGAQNWGYATSHYFAIEYGGGGRDQYKFFVRECHRRGMAVIIDVVYNHYIHQAERAEWMRDTDAHEKNSYYWYEGHSSDYPDFDRAVPPDQRGRGGYLDNLSTAFAPRYHEEMVRKMFISSAVALITDFHVDGFRVDQTTSIHSYNALHADGRPVPDANIFGAKFLRELTRTLRLIKPEIMLIAEDHSGWDRVTAPTDEDGLGFDAAWYADFYHHLIGDTDTGSNYAKLLKTAGLGDGRALAMDYFAGALASSGNHRVVYSESHDEAGNGRFTKRTIVTAVNGAPLLGETRRYAEARCRCVFAITMLSAGTPMFLFGEEIGAQKDFLYGHVLENREDLPTERATNGQNLFRFYSDIIRFRLAHPGLRTRLIDVFYVHNESRVLAFRRWGNGEEFLVLVSLRDRPFAEGYAVEHARLPDGQWREAFNTDAAIYGGDNVGNLGAVIPANGGRFTAVIPANGAVVFRRI
ncbi:MAG: alpha amylase C-terminal domain-containing protein [Verrucomicrobia bacterium]|nr:alpha amylase C-terminal domain-containing protein [Verrucomicrobiota bacterium]